MKSKPKLSVCLITYNQENFIKDCIEGILNQKTDFEIEIVIGNDCSTDMTSNICEYYTNLHSNIKHNFRKVNLGMSKNWATTLLECSGEYIAICEGDDYWSDPFKLQYQVNFLDNNQDYVLCFHKVKILNIKSELSDDYITIVPDNYEDQITLATLGNYIHTPTVLFRNVLEDLPPEFILSPLVDFFLYILLTENGKIKYIELEMAVYRFGVGLWSSENQLYKDLKTMECFSLIHKLFINKNKVVSDIFRNRIEDFFKNYDIVSLEILERFNVNPIIKELIFKIQINKKLISPKNVINEIKTLDLLKEIIKRIIVKFRIKLKC